MGNEKIRLDKFLASQNIGSRKEVSKIIKSGRVEVGGERIFLPDHKLNAEDEIVTVDGEIISYSKYIYIMMNKPAGLLSATEDKKSKTVLDIIPPEMYRRGLFPAGRLDKDTTGLLIITDDGEYAHKMLSPKKNVFKRYEVKAERDITGLDIQLFKQGIEYKGIKYAPAKLEVINDTDKSFCAVEITEGKFHQVKRMFESVDNLVLQLKRVSIGELLLDENLEPGECKILNNEEKGLVFLSNVY